MRDINLKATEYFESVVRLGSVTKAAEELGVSPSAVSQQIRLLETQFGVKLFRREKRRLVLTLDGDRLFHTTTQAFGLLRNARSYIMRQRQTRALTVRISPSLGERWLCPRIDDFVSSHTDWVLRVDSTPEFSEFETEAVDCDVRYGMGAWPGLSVGLVMHDIVMPVCTRAYRERLLAHSPDLATQLGAARLIDSVKALYRWEAWLAAQGLDVPEVSYPFRFDRSAMSIALAKEGAGVALDSISLCLPELTSGELVPLAPQCPAIDFPAYWFVCPARHFGRRTVKQFFDWLRDQATRHDTFARAFLMKQGCRTVSPDRDGTLSRIAEAS